MKYLICNLKAHKTYEEILTYKEDLKELDFKNINFILAPSNIYLPLFKDENITLCTQDISLNNNLLLTADTSIQALKSLNVKYALIGHYERRKYYAETHHIIIAKIKEALANQLKIIYCIGESFEELSRHVEYLVLERQIANILNAIPSDEYKNIIIAYEPSYLIEKSSSYNLDKIATTITFIKELIKDYYQEEIKVVFGGNIKPANINELLTIKDLDGFIICSSILNFENLKNIVKIIQEY